MEDQERKFPPAERGFIGIAKSFIYFFFLFMIFYVVGRITSQHNSDSTFLITFFLVLGIAIFSSLILHKKIWWGLVSLIPFGVLVTFASSLTLSPEETGYVMITLMMWLPLILLWGLIMFYTRYYYKMESKAKKLSILITPFILILFYGLYQYIVNKKLTFNLDRIF